MGLFTFGKKTKPPKDISPQNNPLKSIPEVSPKGRSQLPYVSNSTGELEKGLSDLLVGDVNSPLAMATTREGKSLLDDILTELTGQSLDQNFQMQDDLQSNASAALQLASRLEFSYKEESAKGVGSNSSNPATASDQSNKCIDGSVYRGLFSADSIYSPTAITGSSQNSVATAVNRTTTSPNQEESKLKERFVVLDSDVSDSEESDGSDDSDEEYHENYKLPGKPRDIIMNRRKQHLAVEANKQAMIDRMKERHRLEARTAVLRSQTLKQNHLTSSSRYHSMQALTPPSNALLHHTASVSYPNQSFQNSMPITYSMQGISARLNEQDSVTLPNQFNEVNMPFQSFARAPTPLMVSPSYSHSTIGPSYTEIRPDVRPSAPSRSKKPGNLNFEQSREKSSQQDGVLRKSRSFTNDQSKRRVADAGLPPLPDSPMSEPSLINNMYIRGRSSHSKHKDSNRISSNTSSSTEESDTPYMPRTPDDISDQVSHLQINRQSDSRYQLSKTDTGSPMDRRAINTVSGYRNGIKHAKSESNLRRHVNPVTNYEEEEYEDRQRAATLKEDSELKWHYRCFRQQDVYTTFADYLAAIQYQKLMLRRQQLMYNPFHPALHANANNFI
ncbi:hypothetical protein INT43_008103 [Umbelopsis isabellina]|uniref:Uncharacterized protein n=1 Tax=Mortierella isabellina TaxID=91625 RepID=A0A8H7PD81_MORIS|nr:hypothetical protein INT43_008103 [Umbelopsis isabellina]